ncbi:MAG: hypothetical protein V3V55_01870, partial [Rhodospirillales bacterium]
DDFRDVFRFAGKTSDVGFVEGAFVDFRFNVKFLMGIRYCLNAGVLIFPPVGCIFELEIIHNQR